MGQIKPKENSLWHQKAKCHLSVLAGGGPPYTVASRGFHVVRASFHPHHDSAGGVRCMMCLPDPSWGARASVIWGCLTPDRTLCQGEVDKHQVAQVHWSTHWIRENTRGKNCIIMDRTLNFFLIWWIKLLFTWVMVTSSRKICWLVRAPSCVAVV